MNPDDVDKTGLYAERAEILRNVGFLARSNKDGLWVDMSRDEGVCRVWLNGVDPEQYGLYIMKEVFSMGVEDGVKKSKARIRKALGF